MTKQFIIAAPNSNAGKTTITLGLLRLFKNKNIAVQPFKVGPDYIDPKFHQLASARTGVNLDLFMMTPAEIKGNLNDYGHGAQVNCIEGVMGLFDGAEKDKGSTAAMAKTLETPVLLVIDAKAVAYSVAPLIQGFFHFDKEVDIMGVVFNRVGSKRHYSMLKEACDDIGVRCFGYLPYLKNIAIPSRHLGLNIDALEKFDVTIDLIANELNKSVAWEAILQASKEVVPAVVIKKTNNQTKKMKFAVAKDAAFNFCYPQNIAAMQALGTVVFFSPLNDTVLPDCDVLYFPGGYPECFLAALSHNTEMLKNIYEYATNDGSIYAECGGMMYLGKSIISEENEAFKMVGYFDFDTTIADKKLHLGYRTTEIDTLILKGHEFHYSSLINDQEITMNASVVNARGAATATKIYKKNKVLGSYVHQYFGTPEAAQRLINQIT